MGPGTSAQLWDRLCECRRVSHLAPTVAMALVFRCRSFCAAVASRVQAQCRA